MKKYFIIIAVTCLFLVPLIYLGFTWANNGLLGVYLAISPHSVIESEGLPNWQYSLADGTVVGVGKSYYLHSGMIDGSIWSHQKMYIYLKKKGIKTVIRTIDLSKYKPFKDIYNFEIVKIKPDDSGSKVLIYWLDNRGLFAQVLRNVPLEMNEKWLGRVDRLPIMDPIKSADLDFPKYKK